LDLRGTRKQGLKKATKRGFLYVLTKYYSRDQIKKNTMDGACNTYGGRRGIYKVLWGNLRVRKHLEVLSIDGWILLKRLSRK
jgi:hypothetical protein